MNIDTKRFEALIFTPMFLVRRLTFALIVVMIKESLAVQVCLVQYCSLGLLVYLILITPMETNIHNKIQIFNESLLLILAGMLFLFTEYVESPITRYDIGWWLIYGILFNIIVNILSLALIGAKMLQEWCHKKSLEKACNERLVAVKKARLAGSVCWKEDLYQLELYQKEQANSRIAPLPRPQDANIDANATPNDEGLLAPRVSEVRNELQLIVKSSQQDFNQVGQIEEEEKVPNQLLRTRSPLSELKPFSSAKNAVEKEVSS